MVASVSPALPDAPPVTFDRDRLSVTFDRFDSLPAYRLFLTCKQLPESDVVFDPAREAYTISAPARFAPLLGTPRPPVRDAHPLWPALYPDQAELVTTALDAKRFALWCQCGYGKTLCGLEWARQVWLRTGGRVLIVTLNDIVGEWLREAERFYGADLPLTRLAFRHEMIDWMRAGGPGIAITNYEKWNSKGLADQVVPEAKYLAGVALDENRLKTSGGKQKWALVKSLKGVEYKLVLTATPAPNHTMEFASQAAFLEKMRTDRDVIWTFFTRDPKTHRWTVKPYARTAFFEWMSSWSIYVNDPRRYGWRVDRPEVPRPVYHTIDVPPTAEQLDVARELLAAAATGQKDLFAGVDVDTNTIQRAKLSQVAKGFRYARKGGRQTVQPVPSQKPTRVAEIVRQEAKAGAQVLVWTVFDAESEILLKELARAKVKGVEALTGKTKPFERLRILERYRTGETRVLVTRASVLGWGMNLQMTGAMVFSGWTDSFEQVYQAVRRAYRAGQEEILRVYFVLVRELEGDTFDNIQAKEAEFERSIEEMEGNYVRARARLSGKERAA